MTPALLLAMGGQLSYRPRAARGGRLAACKRTPQTALLTPAGLGPSGRPFTPCPPAVDRAQWQQQQRPGRQVARSAALAVPAGVESALALLETPLARDMAAAALAVVGSKMLVRFFAVLEMHEVINRNTSRKLVHTLAGPLFILTWPLFSSAPYARAFAAIVPVLNILRLLLVGLGLREDRRAVEAMSRTGQQQELLRGPLYYTIVLLAVTGFYWRESAVGLIIVSLMCGGDGLADLVGRRWGRSNPLPWNPAKSWSGSAAMFLGGLGFSMAYIALFHWLGYIEAELQSIALAVGAISLAATAIESLPLEEKVDDNLTVPGVAAFMGIMLLQVAVELL